MRDLDELLDDTLRLPIGGKTYVIPGPDAETGLWCLRLGEAALAPEPADQAMLVLNDAQELSMYQRVLGPAYDEMTADKVSFARIAFAGQTAFVWITNGPVAAEAYWENVGKAPTPPNRAARRSTGSGGVGATQSPGSTNGTKSPPKKKTPSPAARGRSSGKT
jgi:hypothetical protein